MVFGLKVLKEGRRDALSKPKYFPKNTVYYYVVTYKRNVVTYLMTLEPDYKFGLLSSEDEEKLERILCERSQGAYGGPRLHGMLTASVVGPAPVPLDFIVQTVLNGPDSEQDGFDDFPEFSSSHVLIMMWRFAISTTQCSATPD